jgi:hypothetical protein
MFLVKIDEEVIYMNGTFIVLLIIIDIALIGICGFSALKRELDEDFYGRPFSDYLLKKDKD